MVYLSRDELSQLAALAEQRSEHAIANVIVQQAQMRSLSIAAAEESKIEPGLGIEARANGHRVIVGNRRMIETRAIAVDANAEAALTALEAAGHSPVLIAENSELQGILGVQDVLRSDAQAAIKQLHNAGIARVVLLTGDRERIANNIGRGAGVDEIHVELLPQQKVELIERLKRDGLCVAMIGDDRYAGLPEITATSERNTPRDGSRCARQRIDNGSRLSNVKGR